MEWYKYKNELIVLYSLAEFARAILTSLQTGSGTPGVAAPS